MGQTLWQMVESFARNRSLQKEPTIYHWLYGFASVLSMDEGMLENLLSKSDRSEMDKQEIQLIRTYAEENRIDMELVKKGMILITSCELDALPPVKVGEVPADSGKGVRCHDLFRFCMEENEDVIATCQTGKALEDVMALKDRVIADLPDKTKEEHAQKEQSGKEECEGDFGEISDSNGTDAAPLEKTKTQEADSDTPKDSISMNTLAEELALRSRNLYYELSSHIIGQDDAIEIFCRACFTSELFEGEISSRDVPKAIFLFAGPPGVGKTMLANQAAKALGKPSLLLNMSEYSDHQSAIELIGVPATYPSHHPGKLTDFVAENPDCVVIFDEIEKSHPNVIQLFLQILDSGMVQDMEYGKNVSFKKAMLIFTTNAGKKLYDDNFDKNLSLLDQTVVLNALQKERSPVTGAPLFPPAICSRFNMGNIVVFNHLRARHLLDITRLKFDACCEIIKEKLNLTLNYAPEVPSLFLFYKGTRMDARIISSQSVQFLQNEIYEFVRQMVDTVDVGKIRNLDMTVDVKNADPDICELFCRSEKTQVLYFGKMDSAAVFPEMNGITVCHAASRSEAEKILEENDISFVIIDPFYGKQARARGISLEDSETEGVKFFHTLRSSFPQMEIFLQIQDEKLRDVDRITFLRQGSAGFISCIPEEAVPFAEELKSIAFNNHMQSKMRQLSSGGKRLGFNTAQRLDENGTKGNIEFYDLQLSLAVDSDDQRLVLEEGEKPDTTFEDVIGAEDVKEELKHFIEFLQHPRKFMFKGEKAPRGILLYGPPGTGKTMLARAMAGEADATFLPANATDFMAKYVGEGEERIRNIFKVARKYAPSIIFIDEIDAIAKERTGESHVETYLNALMTEMDGFRFDPACPVFVLAATNFPIDREKAGGRAALDPALVRRFDNKIKVDLPDKDARLLFLKKQIEKLFASNVEVEVLENIADRTTGMSLAILQNILDLATRKASGQAEALQSAHLLEAIEEYNYGAAKDYGRDYYESVAIHESGHAYLHYLSGRTPSYLTIVSRDDFGGYMQGSDSDSTPNSTREQLLMQIRTALAGRAAEIVFFGEEAGMNTGVSSDLQSATGLAIQMICRYGMDGKSLISMDPDKVLQTQYGEQVLRRTDEILKQEMENAIAAIRSGRDKVEVLSQKLLEKNQMTGTQIVEIFSEA